jgi:6-phosphogluconolactonase (cycloisomerase 2 family)
VTNNGAGTISAYAVGDTGNVSPHLTISGPNTTLSQPTGIARDQAGIVLVADANPPRILVFAANAVGDQVPIARIEGTNTGLSVPRGLALDVTGQLYVANAGTNSVLIFANGAQGNVAPAATISGANTALSTPEGLAFDFRGRLYVSNAGANYVTIYDARATGNIKPTDTLAGPATGFNTPVGLALDPSGRLYVANSGTGAASSSIAIFASGAKGNVAPIDTIAGASTGLDQPSGVALDGANQIYVVNGAFTSHLYSITVYGPGARGDVAPVATIAGNNTGLTGPFLLSF